MGNSGKITEFIDTAATGSQYKTFAEQIDILDAKFVELTKSVISFNNAAKEAKGFADFNKNAAAAALSAEKLLQVQNQTAITAAKLAEQELKLANALEKSQAARDKTAAKQNAQTQKDIADSQRRVQQSDREAEANARALLRSQRSVENARRPYQQLQTDLERLRAEARDIGTLFGTQSQQFQNAARGVNALDQQIKKIDKSLGQNQRNVGNYAEGFSKAFGFLRQAAYILPGIGIAGIFNLIGEGLADVYNAIKGGESILTLNRTLTEAANKAYATQSTNVRALVAELKDQNTVTERRQEILEQLNKISPTYFGNLKSEQDIVQHLQEDYAKYNAALQLEARIKAAQQIIGEKYTEQLKAELILARLNNEETQKSGVLRFLQEYVKVLGQLTAAGGFNEKINKGIFKEVEESKIKGITKNIQQLTDIIVKSQQALQKNGGDTAGEQIVMQERVTNNATEQQKIILQSVIDANNDIVNNDKKSYRDRQSALATSIAAQKQLRGLTLNQELNDVKLTNDRKAVITEQYNADITKLDIQREKQSRDLRTKAAKDDIELENQRLERQKKTSENVFNNPDASYQQRFDALARYQKAATELIRNAEKTAISDAGDNAAKVKTAEEKAASDILEVKTDVAKKTLAIQKDINEQNAKFLKADYDARVAAEKAVENIYTNAGNDQLLAIDKSYSDRAALLAQQYAEGEISTKKYNSSILKLDQTTAQERLQVQIDTARKILSAQAAAAGLGFGDPKALQKSATDLVKLQIQQSDLLAKTQIDNIRKVQDVRAQNAEYEKQLVQQSIDLIQQLVDQGYQNEINALQDRAAALDDSAAQEKDNIDNSLASNQTKADKQKIIDAQTLDSKKSLAEEEKQIRKKEAEFNKGISLFNIALTTAESIFKIEAGIAAASAAATAYLAIPVVGAGLYAGALALIQAQQLEVGLVLASGAVQAAAVAAASPKYAKGTNYHPGGKAWVGDAGYELIKLPDGNSFLSEDKPTLMDLPEGTTVVPHLPTVSMLQKINYTGEQSIDMREANKLLKENNRYQKKIADKPVPQSNTRDLAWQIVSAQSQTARRNSYFQ